MATVKAIVCRVGRLPAVEEIEADTHGTYLDALERIVGGSRVTCVSLMDGLDLWANDDALSLGLPLNRRVPYPFGACPIHGDFAITRVNRQGGVEAVEPEDFERYLDLWDTEDVEAAQLMNQIRVSREAVA